MYLRTILSILPRRLQLWFFYRFFSHRQTQYPELFKCADLKFAPGFYMKNLMIGDMISALIAFTGFYELDLSRTIQRLSKKGGVFVDVGANLGYFSLLWLNGNKENRVVAFEASPRNQVFIKENVEANNAEPRFYLFKKAAGDRNGKVIFDSGPQDQTSWGGIRNDGISGSGTMEIDMVRLDDTLKDEKYIEVMKIDVEGADFLVIKGCEQLLKQKKIGRIYFEENTTRMKMLGIKPGRSREFLEALGYSCAPFVRLGKTVDEFVASKN